MFQGSGRVYSRELLLNVVAIGAENIMKAFILDRNRTQVALRAGETADPEVREDDVLVQVHAAGVNLLDSPLGR